MIPKIATFDDMVAAARQAGPVRVAVAAAHDLEVLKAVDQAQREGMIQATLVGDGRPSKPRGPDRGGPQPGGHLSTNRNVSTAARHVVRLAREGQASVVVKGQVKTSELLSAALNRHMGSAGAGC